ncbi:MAG: hypothetical protein V5A57_03515 [Candidatus Paceibacterota bacterium]
MKTQKVSGNGKKDTDDLEDLINDVLVTKDIEETKKLSELISALKDILTDESKLKDLEEYNSNNFDKILDAQDSVKAEEGIRESFVTYRHLLDFFSEDEEPEDVFEERSRDLFNWGSDDKEDKAELAHKHFSKMMDRVSDLEEKRIKQFEPLIQELKHNERIIRGIITRSQDKKELLSNLEKAIEIIDSK